MAAPVDAERTVHPDSAASSDTTELPDIAPPAAEATQRSVRGRADAKRSRGVLARRWCSVVRGGGAAGQSTRALVREGAAHDASGAASKSISNEEERVSSA